MDGLVAYEIGQETDHCEILGGRCPYDHPCSQCRLCREYGAAKELSERLGREVERDG